MMSLLPFYTEMFSFCLSVIAAEMILLTEKQLLTIALLLCIISSDEGFRAGLEFKRVKLCGKFLFQSQVLYIFIWLEALISHFNSTILAKLWLFLMKIAFIWTVYFCKIFTTVFVNDESSLWWMVECPWLDEINVVFTSSCDPKPYQIPHLFNTLYCDNVLCRCGK